MAPNFAYFTTIDDVILNQKDSFQCALNTRCMSIRHQTSHSLSFDVGFRFLNERKRQNRKYVVCVEITVCWQHLNFVMTKQIIWIE